MTTSSAFVNTESEGEPERRAYLEKLVSSYGHKGKRPEMIREEPETPLARVEHVVKEMDVA